MSLKKPSLFILFLVAAVLLQAAAIVTAARDSAATRLALRGIPALQNTTTQLLPSGWWLHPLQPLECDPTPDQMSITADSARAQRLWGVVDLLCGRFVSAQARLRTVASARPHDRSALALLRAAEQQTMMSEPEQAWRGVVGWRLALGEALELYRQGAVDQATAWLAVVNTELQAPAKTEYTQLYFWSCEILRAAGRLDVALAACQKLTLSDPANPEAWNQLGASLHQARRYEPALEALAQAIALDPTWTLPRIHSGRSLRALGRIEAAEAAFLQVLQLEPNNVWARIELGVIALEAGDCAATRVHIEIIESQTINSNSLQQRAKTLIKNYQENCF